MVCTKASKMKNAAIAIALLVGSGLLSVANSTDAYARGARVVVTSVFYGYGYGWYRHYSYNPWAHFSAAKYIECSNKVIPERVSSPGLVFMIDACYLDHPW
jgi:hypothetical protein